jgi:tetratricopeptide (TPR) repeat protein
MKSSPLRSAVLLTAFFFTSLLPHHHAGGAGGNREREKENRPNQSRPPQQQRPAAQKSHNQKGSAPHSQGARNPITGSNVSRQPNSRPGAQRPNQGQNDRPRQEADNKPKDKPAANGGNRPENRPNQPENRPNQPANRPAPDQPSPRPMPNQPETRPAPKGPNQPDNRPGDKRPNQPDNRPGDKGPNQADNRPGDKRPNQPDNRPGDKRPNQPDNRPAPRPPALADKRPGNNNDKRPGDRPNQPNHPNGHKPFVPGKVTYPGQVARPSNRPGSNNNLNVNNKNVNVNNNKNINVNNNNNVNNNRNRPVNHPNRIAKSRPQSVNTVVSTSNTNNNWGNQWNNNNTTIWNNNQTTYRGPVVINQNFQNSVNYAYRPASWGARPWWSSSTYHSWHHGSWNYGWNNSWNNYHRPVNYYRPPVQYFPGYQPYLAPRPVVPWGIAAWGLGSLYYNSGYSSYRNPYQAPPVQTRTTVINYSQPISVVASQEVPEPQEAALTSEEMSTAALQRARDAFSNGDYLSALKATDESISFALSDPALHEFRALCLFALGRYGDAAGVLNPVLASGPGWDWATMSAFYPDGEIYTAQLRKLEAYVESMPDSADSQFLLGYHYLVAGFIDEAYGMFDRVTTLQPADTVAVQLRNLTGSSSPTASPEEAEMAATADAPPAGALADGAVVEVIIPDDVIGGWKATSGDGKVITLTLNPDGPFVWNYEGATDGKVLSGEWSIDEEGQLILAAEDVQMVAEISLNGDIMQFILAGSPVGDTGLSFQRLP